MSAEQGGEATTPTGDSLPAGYIIAGPEHGRLVADWDGEVHQTREAGDEALAECHIAGWPGWQLYALCPVPSAQSGR